MPRRSPSPARSENEVDIADDLYVDDGDDDEVPAGFGKNGKNKKKVAASALDLDFNDLLGGNGNGGDGGWEDDGDEAFIASRQRSSNRKASNAPGKSAKKGGGFQAMGLSTNVLKAITKKGYQVPTPIQRKAIPLVLDRKDVVGMARTGSGKTAAFVIPMIERLKGHSPRVGARALILSPSRELALQTLKVVKEFGKGTDLKAVLVVGGDSLEEQFGLMTANPDIIIATPGRFLHLKVEMGLNLSSIKYVVFDEADRLFEMGFAAQLTEILHALPPSRQTLLFSATLPSSLVEFARAGLQDPSLVRLDAETKVSPDLESAFFSIKGGEKEGALLHILHDVIKMPMGLPAGVRNEEEDHSKKRKRGPDRPNPKEKPTEHSTIIFTATKHHVDYLTQLLRHAGFAVSYVYGSLDQTARMMQVDDFRRGRSNILVVTDVAARGIDIPVLANVINYDFPPQPKIFVHRVGRTARAGQRGWAFGLVRDVDLPYLVDLQLFLGRRLVVGQDTKDHSFAQDVVIGTLKRNDVESNVEWVKKVLDESDDIRALRGVSVKAEKLYMRTRNSAASSSAKRAREIMSTRSWAQLHPLFGDDAAHAEEARDSLLTKISLFKPQETVFELGPKGKSTRNKAAEVIRSIRAKMPLRKTKMDDDDAEDAIEYDSSSEAGENEFEEFGEEGDVKVGNEGSGKYDDYENDNDDSDDEVEVTVSKTAVSRKGRSTFEDPEVFMSYLPRTNSAAEERAYGVHSGSQNASFIEAARDVAMDLTNDDGAKTFGMPTRAKLRWDKKQSKYVARVNDDDGSRGAKMIRGESGVKIAASFQSGRFDKWRKAQRVSRPHVGEAEKPNHVRNFSAQPGVTRFKHNAERAPKDADKFRDDYHIRKKRVAEAKENRVGKYRNGEGSKRELKSAVDIRKARQIKEQKMAKNARPTKRVKR
ncbi:P-loop containing nucleoside triphosphate hydrolase protein [Lasiosphaeria miniovina]|uniref:RNA helicase n=1 Tax=Lasiosphaeria miniovina TaxID=1954250 RepID=A0AA40E2X2_9PEZI|nr:P-loop containing nucleoside triphosphate hydrolase protein [Lasiosphaeria miniovina]KAK0722181.1 P-loop containing nucleoside triphosphate hydrolase protein [Lasiosphaeria miniovina]